MRPPCAPLASGKPCDTLSSPALHRGRGRISVFGQSKVMACEGLRCHLFLPCACHRCTPQSQSRKCRSRSAFAMTDTELSVIAALAIIGLSSRPNTG